MAYKTIILEKKDKVAKLTLNRPDKMNGLDQEMCQELVAATEEVGKDGDVKAVIITGSGKAFCAGGDLSSTMYDVKDPKALSDIILMFGQVSVNINTMAKPTIAMVNGAAVGAGFSFALACDMRIASDKARFGHVYLNIGVQSDAGGTYFLPIPKTS